MGHQKQLKFAIIPSVLLLLLSLISVVLTTTYWIIGDWVIGRWQPIASTFPEKDRFPIDDVIIDYTESSTNATIVSGCLNLTAAVVAVVAWFKLRRASMDSDINAPVRRFYVFSVFITGLSGICAAIGSVATHYTDIGPDSIGCTTTTGKAISTSVPFTNLLCSRQMGMCNFCKPTLVGKDKYSLASATCNMTVFVKWFQLALILNGIVVMGLFTAQARLRRKTRWSLASQDAKGSRL